jgi:hypothetical protein
MELQNSHMPQNMEKPTNILSDFQQKMLFAKNDIVKGTITLNQDETIQVETLDPVVRVAISSLIKCNKISALSDIHMTSHGIPRNRRGTAAKIKEYHHDFKTITVKTPSPTHVNK